MGNVQMHYRASRGTHNEGDPIENGKDFFNDIIEHAYPATKAIYDGAPAEQKEAVKQILGDDMFFRNKSDAEMWIMEKEDDEEELTQMMNALKPILQP